MQRQLDEIHALDRMLAGLAPDVAALPTDRGGVNRIVAQLRQHWNEVNDLALSRRFADVADREAMNRDFIDKRRLLFAGGMILLLLSAAATLLLVVKAAGAARVSCAAARGASGRAPSELRGARGESRGRRVSPKHDPQSRAAHAVACDRVVDRIARLPRYHSEADRKVIQRLERRGARILEAADEGPDRLRTAPTPASSNCVTSTSSRASCLRRRSSDDTCESAASRGLKLERRGTAA